MKMLRIKENKKGKFTKIFLLCSFLLVLSVVLVSADWCYQESADTSDQTGIDGECSLEYTGLYSTTGGWVNIANAYDGDWGTWAQASNFQTSYLYINYSKPDTAEVTSLWQVKDPDATTNLTITQNCWDEDADVLMLRALSKHSDISSQVRTAWYCYDGVWAQLRTTTTGSGKNLVYEEAMIWNATTGSSDETAPNVTINTPLAQNYTTNSITFNVTAVDETAMDSCWYSLDAGVTNNTMTNATADDYNATNSSMTQGSHTADFYCNDTTNNLNNSESVTFFIDSIIPSVSSLTETPSDPTTYSFGGTYEFNATITDTNLETVLFEFDGVNYSATNLTADVYNVTFTDLSAGVYNYVWYVNDSYGNINSSESGSYTINTATLAGTLTNTDTWTEPYLEEVTIGLTESNGGDGDVTYVVYRDGVSKATGETVTLGVGTYDYVLNSTGGANYSTIADMDSETFTVTAIAPTGSLAGTASINYLVAGDVTGSETNAGDGGCTYLLYRDDVQVNNPDTDVLGVGVYDYIYNTTGCANYSASASLDTFQLTVNKIALTGTASGSSPINYLVAGDVTGGESNTGDGDVVYKLYREGVEVSNPDTDVLGVGVWNYIYNSTGGANYSSTASIDTFALTVNKISPAGNMIISGTTTITYPTVSDFSPSETNTGDSGCSYNMDLSNRVYGVGESPVTFNYSTTGCDNYTAGSVTEVLTINQNTTYVLGISGTTPITYGATTDVAGSDCPAELSCSLDIANAVYGVEVSPLTFNYSTSGNANYSAKSNTIAITINPATPSGSLAGTASIDYGTAGDVTGSETNNNDGGCSYLLYREGGAVSNPDNDVLEVGVYNYVWNTTGCTNYTSSASLDTFVLTVGQEVPAGSLAGTSPINYLVAGDVTGSESNAGDGDVTYLLYRDGALVNSPDTTVLGAGTYNYVWNTTGGANWTANASLDTFSLTVDKIALSASITNDRADTFTYDGTPANIGISESNTGDGDVTYILYKDSVNVGSSDAQAGVGAFSYLVNSTGGANYSTSASLDTKTLTINKATPTGTVSGTSPITYLIAGDVTGSESNGGDDDVSYKLYRDGVEVSTPNTDVLGAGAYNYIWNSTEGANYSAVASLDTFVLTVNKANPTASLTTSLTWNIESGLEVIIGLSESNTGDGDLTYEVFRDDVSKGTGETWTPALGSYDYILNTTGGANYSSIASLDSETLNVGDATPPSVVFNSQDPADINSSNVFVVGLNISYNISDINLNTSTIDLLYKVNSTTSDETGVIVNGTPIFSGGGFTSLFITESNVSDVWTFSIGDNSIYPGTYNFNEVTMESTAHSIYDLDSSNDYLKIELFNVSNTKQYNMFEVMANTSGSKVLRAYYCNSSYTTGNPVLSDNCNNFYNLDASSTFAHIHTTNSKHQILPMAIDTGTGMVGDVVVTSESQFLIRGQNPANKWDVYYISDISRTDAIQTSTNKGSSWTNLVGTVDAHLHQFDGTETFYSYACANDTTNNQNCTEVRSDLLDLGGLPPNAPNIYNPVEGFYVGNMTINYTASVSPNAYDISFYNISLLNSDETFNQTIQTNNSLNLSYVFDTSSLIDGEYFIRVEACDVNDLCSFGFSENITVDNTNTVISIANPTAGQGFGNFIASILISGNASATDTNLDSCWYEVTGADTITNTTQACTSAVYSTFTLNIDVSGTSTLTFYANDSAGNENSDSVNFTVSDYSGPRTSGGSSGTDSDSDGADSSHYNRAYFCEKSQAFLTLKSSNYTEDEFDDFKIGIEIDLGFAITRDVLKSYVDDFNSNCPDFLDTNDPISISSGDSTSGDSGIKPYMPFIYITIIVILALFFWAVFDRTTLMSTLARIKN